MKYKAPAPQVAFQKILSIEEKPLDKKEN